MLIKSRVSCEIYEAKLLDIEEYYNLTSNSIDQSKIDSYLNLSNYDINEKYLFVNVNNDFFMIEPKHSKNYVLVEYDKDDVMMLTEYQYFLVEEYSYV